MLNHFNRKLKTTFFIVALFLFTNPVFSYDVASTDGDYSGIFESITWAKDIIEQKLIQEYQNQTINIAYLPSMPCWPNSPLIYGNYSQGKLIVTVPLAEGVLAQMVDYALNLSDEELTFAKGSSGVFQKITSLDLIASIISTNLGPDVCVFDLDIVNESNNPTWRLRVVEYIGHTNYSIFENTSSGESSIYPNMTTIAINTGSFSNYEINDEGEFWARNTPLSNSPVLSGSTHDNGRNILLSIGAVFILGLLLLLIKRKRFYVIVIFLLVSPLTAYGLTVSEGLTILTDCNKTEEGYICPDSSITNESYDYNISKFDDSLITYIIEESSLPRTSSFLDHILAANGSNTTFRVVIYLLPSNSIDSERGSINAHFTSIIDPLSEEIRNVSSHYDSLLIELAKKDLNITQEYISEGEQASLIEYASEKYPEITNERDQRLDELLSVLNEYRDQWRANRSQLNVSVIAYQQDVTDLINSGGDVFASSYMAITADVNIQTLLNLSNHWKVSKIVAFTYQETHPDDPSLVVVADQSSSDGGTTLFNYLKWLLLIFVLTLFLFSPST